MKALVVGCGRVGSSVAKRLAALGWAVSVVDEKEEALGRLGDGWDGAFVVGHGMDANVLEQAGIADADAVVVATNGDNTNIVVGQVARKRFEVPLVVVRILDPARAHFYAQQGMKTVCPTQTAIDQLTDSVLTFADAAGALEEAPR
ncbi:MAG TPA: TrkA family potassium uptake protein [Gaiellaceae bacterium]|nr:TrkA family potassium uptake protein [Gaiellaceae bacterium]